MQLLSIHVHFEAELSLQVHVLNSKPTGLFEKEAKNVFSKWLYRPAVLNGKSVKMYHEEVIEFKI